MVTRRAQRRILRSVRLDALDVGRHGRLHQAPASSRNGSSIQSCHGFECDPKDGPHPADEPPVNAARVSFTRAGVWRGFILGQPLAPGIAVYGLVFGALAGERGLSWLQAVLMSAFVYSGSAQLAALQVWSDNANAVLALVVTVLAINARYVLYGASIQPWLSQVPRSRSLPSLFLLGDGSWALAMREHAAGCRDAGFILGSGLAGFIPWVGGTFVGQLLAHTLADPKAWGLDFMLPAFAAAIGISLWRGRADAWPLAAAVAIALPMQLWAPSGWTIVLAGLAAGAAGAWRHGR